jgi:hypothetical protein
MLNGLFFCPLTFQFTKYFCRLESQGSVLFLFDILFGWAGDDGPFLDLQAMG